MSTFKKKMKKFGRQVWELFKGSVPAMLMYFCAGTVMMMLTMKEEGFVWNTSKLIWSIVCVAVAVGYNALISYAQGGNGYEMLVSGNMKRHSADEFGEGYKISTHKEAKEYRVWKGFAIGGFTAIFTIIGGIIFGANGEVVNSLYTGEQQNLGVGFGILLIACILLSGWSLLPVFFMNANGIAVSYFVSIAFAIIPIAMTGVMYIVGAYGKRNKTIRAQELADKAAAAEAAKPKKINYGGLPGTKPKKRR